MAAGTNPSHSDRPSGAVIAFIVAGLIVITGWALISSLGGDDEPPPTTSTTVPASTTRPPSTAVAPMMAIDIYFETLASRSTSSAIDMLASAAPDSPAENYARHQIAVRNILGPATPGSATRSVNSATVCTTPTPEREIVCTEFGDLVTDNELLESFRVEGQPVEALVVVDGPPATVGDVTVRVNSAYQSPTSNALLIVLLIDNRSNHDFETFGFSAEYRPDDAKAPVLVDGSWGMGTTPAGETSQLLLRIPDVPLHGTILLTGWSSGSGAANLTIRMTSDQSTIG
jgi:hypothetical protein